ncbi:hypothetical protein Back2_25510 [Nocardioides baekrokdamisoli]|uniref:DUF3043 domain-containing protein n=1 Tax=Nocardioides baekrokdamisoli TaxID=1804624 RepID=A0A3G9J4B8_9ACTN|nr:DUF3043 domain-containing protein [Nocardioides baekrokdamisoli]BBH18264.1 hypothetical protein Back2_25510 [Nocardioides baekrokdamisoli]
MFGRQKPPTVESASSKEGGKGHATPTRKQAEAAAKARAKAPRSRGEKMRADRLKAQAAVRSGDERFLAERDRGPVRKFLRDFIDSKVNIGEILLPCLVLAVALNFFANRSVITFAMLFTLVLALMAAMSLWGLRIAVRRELKQRFPGVSPKGHVYYALMRSTQMRLMRYPKPQVKVGTKLPESYK